MLKEKHPYNLHLNTSLVFSIHICKCYISIGKCFAHFVLPERVSCLLPWVTPRPPLLLPPLLLPPFPPRVCRQPIRQRHINRRAPSMNEGANKTAIARTTVLDFVWYIQYLTCIYIYIYIQVHLPASRWNENHECFSCRFSLSGCFFVTINVQYLVHAAVGLVVPGKVAMTSRWIL